MRGAKTSMRRLRTSFHMDQRNIGALAGIATPDGANDESASRIRCKFKKSIISSS
jgi:hypothetical protein